MASQSFHLKAVIILPLLPKGSHWLVHQARSVMSFMMGPLVGVHCSEPLRATLPMEVVVVSI